MRSICFAALVLGLPASAGMGGAYAQTTEQTEQTDQSEEDWRRSQRKSTREDELERILNPRSTGIGPNLPPLRTIDTLPEESRRHLQQQRAKVIGEVEFGEEVPEYEPSEAARSDPQLAADEQEAWEVILTDLQGGGGSDTSGEGGPNRVAVAGVGGGAPSSVTRGGSAQSASEILAQLKGLRDAGITPGQGGSGSGARPPSQTDGGGTATTTAPSDTGDAQQATQTGGSVDRQQSNDGSGGGQTDSTTTEAASNGSQTEGGDAGSQANTAADGDASGQSGDASDAGSDGNQSSGGDTGASDASNRAAEPISPLEHVRPSGPSTEQGGARSSASDFLKDRRSSEQDN